ncbi:MAG: hypothetical protein WD116_02065 [Chloroflexota bacterium]
MRDDQLSRLFGSLADASDPDPAVADDLFELLRLEAAGQARPTRRPRMVLLAAALLVVAIGAGAALGTGLIKLPWLVVEPSPSAEPSPTSSAEPSLPVANDDVVPVGSLARTLTELPLHDRPTMDSTLHALVPAGQVVYVQAVGEFGPYEADGTVWYPVAWAADIGGWPIHPDGGFTGWLPIARDGLATVELLEVFCPSAAPGVEQLAGMTAWARLTCYSSGEIILNGGWIAGHGGIVPWTGEPAWLVLPSFDRAIAPAGGGQPFYFVTAPDVSVDPELVGGGTEVRITGHFDDPASAECVIQAGEPLTNQPAESVRTYCRERFVVTSIEVLVAGPAQPPMVGSLVGTLADGIRLREEPGTSAPILGTLAFGSWSYVADGPRQADGYTWWLLAGLGLPPETGCTSFESDPYNCPGWYGWAADASAEGDPWLATVSPDCPAESGPLTPYYGRPPLAYLACFGGESRTYVGWLLAIQDEPGGGECSWEPLTWLACGPAYQLLVGPEGEPGLALYVDPASGVDIGGVRGSWVTVNGRFDDPAAAGCTFGPNPAYYVLHCRSRFVVESIEPTTAP